MVSPVDETSGSPRSGGAEEVLSRSASRPALKLFFIQIFLEHRWRCCWCFFGIRRAGKHSMMPMHMEDLPVASGAIFDEFCHSGDGRGACTRNARHFAVTEAFAEL